MPHLASNHWWGFTSFQILILPLSCRVQTFQIVFKVSNYLFKLSCQVTWLRCNLFKLFPSLLLHPFRTWNREWFTKEVCFGLLTQLPECSKRCVEWHELQLKMSMCLCTRMSWAVDTIQHLMVFASAAWVALSCIDCAVVPIGAFSTMPESRKYEGCCTLNLVHLITQPRTWWWWWRSYWWHSCSWWLWLEMHWVQWGWAQREQLTARYKQSSQKWPPERYR